MQEPEHLFAPYFVGDLEKPDSKLNAIVSAHLDAGTDPRPSRMMCLP
jgi:hypothetical protein